MDEPAKRTNKKTSMLLPRLPLSSDMEATSIELPHQISYKFNIEQNLDENHQQYRRNQDQI